LRTFPAEFVKASKQKPCGEKYFRRQPDHRLPARR
jgi:hypothetical protein